MRDETIADRYQRLDGKRQSFLTDARRYSQLSDPTVLPLANRNIDDPLQSAFQSLSPAGVENLTAKLMLALFPPGMPWYQFTPSARARAELSAEELEQFSALLYARELQVTGKLAASNYLTRCRKLVGNLLVVGNALMRIGDDLRFKTYRLDQYVQTRDGDNRIALVITHETKLVRLLTDAELGRFRLSRDAAETAADDDGLLPLYTQAERQRGGEWTIRQQLADNQSDEFSVPHSPFVAAGYAEIDGEDWARSFIELRIGDLRSLNGISKAITDATVAAARVIPFFDARKGWKQTDLTGPNGKPVQGRVEGGAADGVAFLQSGKAHDLQVSMTFHDRLEHRLSKAMLMESSAIRSGERVTAEEVRGVRAELNGGLGGVYAHIAEEIQIPLLERVVWQMEKDNELATLPEPVRGAVAVESVTGLSALGREAELMRLMQGVQVLAALEGAMAKLNLDVLAERILRLLTVDTVGLVKTPEQLREEFEQQAAQMAQMQAQQQTIETVGAAVEQAAAAQ